MGRGAVEKPVAWPKHWFIIGSIALLALCGYLNASFYIQNQAVPSGSTALRSHHAEYRRVPDIPYLVFTSTCSKRDLLRAKVLEFTLRDNAFKGQVTHIVHNCDASSFRLLEEQANPYNITYFHAVNVKGSEEKELNPFALQAWYQSVNLPDTEFVAIFEVDSFFTRTLDLATLLSGANTIENPTAVAQDAAWYDADEPGKIMPVDLMQKAVGSSSKALQVQEWRDFAVHAPIVLHARHIASVFDRVVEIYPKLDAKYKRMAYPLASSEVDLRHGVTGSLRLTRYNSFAENWNFVDVTKYNPANETISIDSPEYSIYPFTLGTASLSLPLWAGGKQFNMIDTLVPLDFFDCNAWLLEPLPTSMWYYAQNTFGWEGLSTILRTRHTVAVALAYSAYNRASLDQKSRFCPKGFNTNARLSLLPENALSSAISKSAHLYGNDPPPASHKDNLHFVFTSGCSPIEQVQADLLMQSFANVKQPGRLTRLVTGCTTPEQVDRVLQRTSSWMVVHFIPTAMGLPHALRDWLQKSNVPLDTKGTLVLLASDFVFVREFSPDADVPMVTTLEMDPEEQDNKLFHVVNGFKQAKPVFLNTGTSSAELGGFTIKDNVVMAQNWNSQIEITAADAATLCPECKKSVDASMQLNIGYPYVITMKTLAATVEDMVALSDAYSKLHPGIELVAHAAGVSVALLKHNIDILRIDNLALRAASAGPEWHFATARVKVNSFTTKHKLENPCDKLQIIPGPAPWFFRLHGFVHDQWRLETILMPDNVFACDMWLLDEPGKELWVKTLASKDENLMRHTYGVCTGIKVVNELLVANRQAICREGFNKNQQLQLVDPRSEAIVRVGHQQ